MSISIYSLQKSLKNLTRKHFPNSIFMTPHYMIRKELIYVCNFKNEMFPIVEEGFKSNNVLVGVFVFLNFINI